MEHEVLPVTVDPLVKQVNHAKFWCSFQLLCQATLAQDNIEATLHEPKYEYEYVKEKGLHYDDSPRIS